jgi:hypothetical protein
VRRLAFFGLENTYVPDFWRPLGIVDAYLVDGALG